jgi:hypothetical protein
MEQEETEGTEQAFGTEGSQGSKGRRKVTIYYVPLLALLPSVHSVAFCLIHGSNSGSYFFVRC